MAAVGDKITAAAETGTRASSVLQQWVDDSEANTPEGGPPGPVQGRGAQCAASHAILRAHAARL